MPKRLLILFFIITLPAALARAAELSFSNFEDISAWDGLWPDRSIVKEGFQSGLWADTVAVTSVKLTDDVLQQSTSLMPDALLFERLDLNRKGLEKVRAAVEAGNFMSARRALVSYFRTRKSPFFFVDPDKRPSPQKSYDTREADRIACHTFGFYDYPPYHFKRKINWELNPVGDIEWTAELNRHGAIATLARTWFFTNKIKYANAVQKSLLDWIGDSKVPTMQVSGMMWSTLNTAIRLANSWPSIWYFLRDCDAFSDDARIIMLKSIWHQTEFLMQFHGSGNGLITESNALVTIGTLFPEFLNASEWKAKGWHRLSREIAEQVYPDGSQIELTPHYEGVCIRAFRRSVDLSRLNGDPVPAGFLKSLKSMYNYLIGISKPDRCIPMLNDSDHIDIRQLASMGNTLFPDERFLFAASDGRKGKPPDETSIAFPYAGQYVMRSGWGKQALYCVMDAGPFGFAHQHEDKLSLGIHAYGADLVIDPGRYLYNGGPFRAFFLSSQAHNVVIVDGKGQHRSGTDKATWVVEKPLKNTWRAEAAFDYVRSGYSEGFGTKRDQSVSQERAVLFLKPDYWIVCDFLTPIDTREHAYDWLWHFGPGAATAGSQLVRFQATTAGVVLLTSLHGSPEIIKGGENPVQGWVSYHYGKREPAPVARISVKASGSVAALTIIYPFSKQNAPIVCLDNVTDTESMVATKVIRPNGCDLVFFSKKDNKRRFWDNIGSYHITKQSNERHSWHGIETNADVAVVRLDANGHQLSCFRFGGTYMYYLGKLIIPQ